jgi:hypothetical protein
MALICDTWRAFAKSPPFPVWSLKLLAVIRSAVWLLALVPWVTAAGARRITRTRPHHFAARTEAGNCFPVCSATRASVVVRQASFGTANDHGRCSGSCHNVAHRRPASLAGALLEHLGHLEMQVISRTLHLVSRLLVPSCSHTCASTHSNSPPVLGGSGSTWRPAALPATRSQLSCLVIHAVLQACGACCPRACAAARFQQEGMHATMQHCPPRVFFPRWHLHRALLASYLREPTHFPRRGMHV